MAVCALGAAWPFAYDRSVEFDMTLVWVHCSRIPRTKVSYPLQASIDVPPMLKYMPAAVNLPFNVQYPRHQTGRRC